LLSHYESILEHYGIEYGLRIARKHLGWYSKGLRGGAEFRADVMRATDAVTVKILVNNFYDVAAERSAP
jgi:tRNA-dihydrouridine synthase B